jgi:peptidoglycan hydrolase-like protein with peptidoglycan-binding domain
LVVATLRRTDFVASLRNKSLDVNTARNDPALAGLPVARADLDANGRVEGDAEADRLFTEVDAFDRNGSRASITSAQADGTATQAGRMARRAVELATTITPPAAPSLRDAGLQAAFGDGGAVCLSRGSQGPLVSAVQDALVRLGHLNDVVDGDFGRKTRAAVEAFQAAAGLPVNGMVDRAVVDALDARLAPAGTPTTPTLRDAALVNGMGTPPPTLAQGSAGRPVVALQYALGRLGLLDDLADGSYGRRTRSAVESLQRTEGLPVTGVVNETTLSALDARVVAMGTRTPAARASSPWHYLSDFTARGLSNISVSDRSRPVNWSHPEIRTAYGAFVGQYWDVVKSNAVECDCKTLALFFMDQFRAKVKADVGVDLPRSSSLPAPSNWTAATADKTRGFFSRVADAPTVRPGYETARAIQDLDPNHSMITGVTVRLPNVGVDPVVAAMSIVADWDPARDNAGDRLKPEVPVDRLVPGDVIFIDHTGDGTYDHAVNVIKVERGDDGKVRRVVLGTGSYDDIKDADGSTLPNGLAEVNTYVEEVTVDLDTQGKVSSSRVTWSSEPGYLHAPRYSAATTLMEMKENGRLRVGRWG